MECVQNISYNSTNISRCIYRVDISGITTPESPYAVCSPIGQDQNHALEALVLAQVVSPGAFASINNLRG